MEFFSNTLFVDAVICAGVEEQTGNSGLQYINPVSQYAEFRLRGADEFEVLIFNSMGKQIYNTKIIISTRLDMSGFANGIYSFKIFNHQKSYQRKMIVLHR